MEECVNLCGGLEPQEKLDCSAVTCRMQDAAYYRSKACQPILKEGEVGGTISEQTAMTCLALVAYEY